MATGSLREGEARDQLLAMLNRRQHWVILCLGEAGRYLVNEIRQRHYRRAAPGEWVETALPGEWLGGRGVLPVVTAARERMDAAGLAAIVGEFGRRRVLPDTLDSHYLIVAGDNPSFGGQVLRAFDAWVTARPNARVVGLT